MAIDHDEGKEVDERAARLAWMIDEFQEARRRRLVRPPAPAPGPEAEVDTKAAFCGAPARSRTLIACRD